nr:uncharacterized protein LOC105868796 isoform X4 [Microcebus murinus]
MFAAQWLRAELVWPPSCLSGSRAAQVGPKAVSGSQVPVGNAWVSRPPIPERNATPRGPTVVHIPRQLASRREFPQNERDRRSGGPSGAQLALCRNSCAPWPPVLRDGPVGAVLPRLAPRQSGSQVQNENKVLYFREERKAEILVIHFRAWDVDQLIPICWLKMRTRCCTSGKREMLESGPPLQRMGSNWFLEWFLDHFKNDFWHCFCLLNLQIWNLQMQRDDYTVEVRAL